MVTFLTEDPEKREICSQYWEKQEDGSYRYKIKEIAAIHLVSVNEITKIVKLNCCYSSINKKCEKCGTQYKYSTRSELVDRYRYSNFCDDCKEEESRLREIQEELYYQSVLDIVRKDIEARNQMKLTLGDFSLKDLIFFLSLIYHSGTEDYSKIESLTNSSVTFSPYYKLDEEIIADLLSKGIIVYNMTNDLNGISLDERNCVVLELRELDYSIRLPEGFEENLSYIRFVDSLLGNRIFLKDNRDEMVELIHSLYIAECSAFIEFTLKEHKLPFSPGKKTIDIVTKYLEHFSVGETYRFIWRAAQQTASFYLRKSVNKRHAANTIVGNLERDLYRSLNDSWEINAFNRNYNLPQSSLSQLVFDRILKINDGGFHLTFSESIEILDSQFI